MIQQRISEKIFILNVIRGQYHRRKKNFILFYKVLVNTILTGRHAICTHGAKEMTAHRFDRIVRLQEGMLNDTWLYCSLHREALTAKKPF